MANPRGGQAGRTFTDDLRGRTDDQLAALLLARPDLARPPAHDITTLAGRATSPAGVVRALDGLDTRGLNALSALIVAGGDPARAGALCGATRAELEGAANELWSLALVWKEDGGYRVPDAVAQALGPHVGGLAPATGSPGRHRHGDECPRAGEAADTPPVAPPGEEDTPPLGILAQLQAAAPEARRLLDSLTWGPPIGDLPPSPPAALAQSVEHLVTRGLLERLSPTRVRLPRDVALALRSGRIAPGDPLHPPAPGLTPVSDRARASALAAVNELIQRIDELGHIMGTHPPRMLKSQALGVRELRRIATALDTERDEAVLMLELAYAAGLIGVAETGGRDVDDLGYAPTVTFDAWRHADPPARWAHLVLAWFGTDRAPGLIGDAPPSAKTAGALGPPAVFGTSAASAVLRAVRHTTLDVLAQVGGNDAIGAADLVALVQWRHPLRSPRMITDGVTMALREASALGVVSTQPEVALTSAGAALWTSARLPPAELDRLAIDDLTDLPATAAALAELGAALPPCARELLLQADLTAVVPGRLDGPLADLMRSAAELESRGGAAVFRFTTDSVRRHLDSGATAEDLLTTLATHSPTGVPQPLDYLVRDVARRHGRIRVGSLGTFIVSDDIGALDAVEHDTTVAGLGLRRLAPTVLAAIAAKHTVVSTLRKAGHSPLVEGLAGATTGQPALTRASERPRLGYSWAPARHRHAAEVSRDDATRAVAALRAGDARAAEHEGSRSAASRPRITATDPAVTLDILRQATATRTPVWIGVADGHGGASRLLFHPTSLEAGRAHGTVEGSGEQRTFSVHRLIGAIPATGT